MRERHLSGSVRAWAATFGEHPVYSTAAPSDNEETDGLESVSAYVSEVLQRSLMTRATDLILSHFLTHRIINPVCLSRS
jgi:hypothetical protein